MTAAAIRESKSGSAEGEVARGVVAVEAAVEGFLVDEEDEVAVPGAAAARKVLLEVEEAARS